MSYTPCSRSVSPVTMTTLAGTSFSGVSVLVAVLELSSRDPGTIRLPAARISGSSGSDC